MPRDGRRCDLCHVSVSPKFIRAFRLPSGRRIITTVRYATTDYGARAKAELRPARSALGRHSGAGGAVSARLSTALAFAFSPFTMYLRADSRHQIATPTPPCDQSASFPTLTIYYGVYCGGCC